MKPDGWPWELDQVKHTRTDNSYLPSKLHWKYQCLNQRTKPHTYIYYSHFPHGLVVLSLHGLWDSTQPSQPQMCWSGIRFLDCHRFRFRCKFRIRSFHKLLNNKWVRSRKHTCLVTWFCYHLIAKQGNKKSAPLWPDPNIWGVAFQYKLASSSIKINLSSSTDPHKLGSLWPIDGMWHCNSWSPFIFR